MKKILFFAFFATTVFSTTAQIKTTVETPSYREQPIMTCIIPQRYSFEDTATKITQQFFKEFNGVIYKIRLTEYPYKTGRNELIVTKTEIGKEILPNTQQRYSEFFFLAPSIKNFRILVSDDTKRLVILYDYGQEKMTIELE